MRGSIVLKSRPLLLSTGVLALTAIACGSEVLVLEGTGGGGGADPSGTGGSGGTCVPGVEICDEKDNDCDGKIDEPQDLPNGCSCTPGEAQACYSGMPPSTAGVGQCKSGTQTCNGGKWGPCVGEVVPGVETCNGLDDDCNGVTDDFTGKGEACQTGLPGECAFGIVDCIGNEFGCNPVVPPTPEVCDALDNDCNGLADEGDPGGGSMCSTGLPGICGPGVLHCQMGALACVPNQAAQMEVCNAVDDDCDGIPDDGNPGGGAACMTGQLGVCSAGTITCTGGSLSCLQNVQPSPEICGNAVDENCDGNAPPGPTIFFNETFADNAQGWTLGNEWGIGPAAASFCNNGATGDDPATDHTPTADNGVAGVIIGGCYTQALHTDHCLTSPTIDLSTATGTVLLTFWRHLHTDYPPFITSRVDVSSNDGLNWLPIFAVQQGQFQNDPQWTQQVFDVTAQKSATFKLRFCYGAGSQGIFVGGGWTVDDVQLSDALCN